VRKCIFPLVLAFLLAGGCGGRDKPRFTKEELARIPLPQRNGFPECSGGFVLAVDDKAITANEVVLPLLGDLGLIAQSGTFEQFKERARPLIEQSVTTRVLNILLYNKAKEDIHKDADDALEKLAETEVKNFFARFKGDNAAAEKALKQMGMNRQSYKEYQKMMILNQSYIASKVPDNRPITYSELLDYYNKMKDEFAQSAMIKFRLIDIDVAKLEVTDPNQDRQEQAQKIANKLMMQLRAGEDFDTLAEKFPGVSFINHSKGVQPENLERPYDILVNEAQKIRPGQITGPIKAEGHLFVMKLEGKRPKGFKPLEDVQKQVEDRIISDWRKKAIDKLEAKLRQQVALDEKEAFIDFCLKKIYQLSNQ